MKKACKKISCILMSLIFMIGSITITAMADEEITVQLNGVQLIFDVAPQMIHSRTMVPMRKIFESLGAEVEWDETTQTITATKDEMKIVMQIKKTDMQVNDKTITLDVPPQIVDDRTLVPVRAVAESFNATVSWDSEKQVVSITTTDDSTKAIPQDCTRTSTEATTSTSTTASTIGNVEKDFQSANAAYTFVDGMLGFRYFISTDDKWEITIADPFEYYAVVPKNGGRLFKNGDGSDVVFVKISTLDSNKETLENMAKGSLNGEIGSSHNGVPYTIEKDLTKETINNLNFYTYTIKSTQSGISGSTYCYTYFTVYDGLLFEFSSTTPNETVLQEFKDILKSFTESIETSK